MNINSKCKICGEDILHEENLAERTCDICGDKFVSNRTCKNGHAVCNKCATKDYFDKVDEYTKNTESKNPITIANNLMNLPEASLLGCKHAIAAYSSVLTAFKNNGGHLKNYEEVKADIRKNTVICQTSLCKLGAFCVIPIAMGIALRPAIEGMDKDTSMSVANSLSTYCISNIGNENYTGSKNCCVRNTYLTIIYASRFISKYLWVDIPLPAKIKCDYHVGNPRCNKEKCAFYKGVNTDREELVI